jgi:ABC-2 type transport system permease protein
VAAIADVLLAVAAFVSFSQVIIYRGGSFDAVWREFLMVAIIGLAFFTYSVTQFPKSIAVTK